MKDLFKVVVLLLRLSKDIPHSKPLVAIILVAGLFSGLSNTLLIATINTTLTKTDAPTSTLVLTFGLLCLTLASMRFISAAVLVRLMEKAMVSLRLSLCSKILSSPLRLLEQLGAHRLLATLTDDVPQIANAFITLPLLCMNLAIL